MKIDARLFFQNRVNYPRMCSLRWNLTCSLVSCWWGSGSLRLNANCEYWCSRGYQRCCPRGEDAASPWSGLWWRTWIFSMYIFVSHQFKFLSVDQIKWKIYCWTKTNTFSTFCWITKRSWNYLVKWWFYFFINIPKTLNWQFCS